MNKNLRRSSLTVKEVAGGFDTYVYDAGSEIRGFQEEMLETAKKVVHFHAPDYTPKMAQNLAIRKLWLYFWEGRKKWHSPTDSELPDGIRHILGYFMPIKTKRVHVYSESGLKIMSPVELNKYIEENNQHVLKVEVVLVSNP